ncbi:MAG: tRNA (adenosine(37)-N6)-threonylcarbamoyltransferase complex dimerization subunit type 1 TsaB [Hyphomicrobiaceae bacterium]
MNILAFDTCFATVSVALRVDRQIVAHLFEPRGGQAERLIPMLHAAMTSANFGFKDLDVLAVTVGPGTFTGVRVGVAAAKGLALSTGVKVAGATSLRVVAHRALDELAGQLREYHMLAVCMDARRDHIYMQMFDSRGIATCAPTALNPQLAAVLPVGHPVLAVGTGAALFAEWMHRRGVNVDVCRPDLLPQASSLADLAESLSPGPIGPLYLRAPDAKPQAGLADGKTNGRGS